MTPSPSPPIERHVRRTPMVAAIVLLQAVAATFFVADAIGDVTEDGFSGHIVIEGAIALALIVGVIFGAWQLRQMLAETRLRATAVAVAQGALADLICTRFAEWRLSPAEADVALFLLKGCDISDIAQLRDVASGTVRAQLASIYQKTGVTSQAQLMSLFLDDLIG
ncbi:MAG: helix-turn-helix transcriptional regulator [Sphingopyxis sp.]